MSKIQEIKSYTPPILHTGKDWYIDFYAFNPVDGVMKRKKIKLNFIKSVKERRAYAKGCINRLSEKLATGWNPWIEQECGNAFLLFKDVIDKYRTFLAKMQRDGRYRQETIKSYSSYLRNMEIFNEEKKVPITYIYQFDKDFCVMLLDEVYITRDNTAFTRDNYLGFLKSFSTFCLNHNYLTQNPTAGISSLGRKGKKKLRNILPPETLAKVSDYLKNHNPYMLLASYILYYCFIRPAEMVGLRLNDISLKKQTIFVSDNISKNRKDGTITLPSKVIHLMLDLHIFKKTLANATLLAAPGLIICMLLTGALMMGVATFIPGFESWTWAFALMFGALISATDPVAVVALLHELKTSKRFSTLVDAESLLNDGTGIVCFMLFFGAYAAGEATHASPVITFIREVGLSTLLGFLLARIVIWFITRINSEEMVQNSVIILAAYLTFILSQYYLGVSGVIALVAFGLTVTYVGKPRLKPQVNTFMEHFWELLTYIANTLIFILVGVVIAEKVDFSWGALGVLILIYIALNLIRFAMIMLLYPVMKRLGYGLTRRESVILTWGGLRGALAMTLALMVSYTPAIPEDIRSQVLFFTAGIVTLTLCINATTMRALLNRLGLTHVPSARTMLAYRIEKSIRDNSEKYLEGLKKRDALEGANWHKVESYMTAQPQEPAKNPQNKAMLPEIHLRVLDKEKAICREIYEEGVISKPVFLRLMNSLDELYDHDGNYPLNVRTSIFKFCQRTDLLNTLRNIPYLQNWMTFYFRERITVVYDLGRGFIILQKGSLKLLDDLRASEWVTGEQDSVLDTLREEINDNINRMSAFINNLADNFPKAYGHALTIKSIRMLLSNERRTVKQLINNGMLSEKDAERLLDDIDERTDEINSFSHTFTASFLRWLFFIKKKKVYRN